MADQTTTVVGGLIADKTIKYTKNDKVMAFLNLEDLVGNVEIVVFPKDYERYGSLLQEEAKIFVKGRVSLEEEKDAKLLCEQIVTFEEAAQRNGQPLFQNRWRSGDRRVQQGAGGAADTRQMPTQSPGTGGESQSTGMPTRPKMPSGLWVQFANSLEYQKRERELLDAIADSAGEDNLVVFLKETKVFKVLPPSLRVSPEEELLAKLAERFGRENVKVVK